MKEVATINQKSIKNSNTTQIGIQNNGLTATDATKIAFEIFREYFPKLKEEALSELEQMVEKKVAIIPPQYITSPSARIVVPTLQYASITEEKDLRELYATLLTNSMNNVVKNDVHPGFVEIINQLSPDEAKILKYIFNHKHIIPTITVRYTDENNNGVNYINNFSDVGELSECEEKYELNKYFGNLIRLGLIEKSHLSSLSDKSLYEPLKTHKYIESRTKHITVNGFSKRTLEEGYMELTDFGKSFCEICLCITIRQKIELFPQKE